MGEVVDFFTGRQVVGSEVAPQQEDLELTAEYLKNRFLEWLKSSVAYKRMKSYKGRVDTRTVATIVEKVNANPDSEPDAKLLRYLETAGLGAGSAPYLFAYVKVLKERFGISD